MPENQYPVFVDGQTLTAVELNDLRAFLHHRDRLLGRLDGFGINAGLGGTIGAGPSLAIDPGLGLDQTGEPLLLADGQSLALPPTPEDLAYDFIDPGAGGFSLVLEATDTIEPAPDCGEDGCAGHAELHTRNTAVHVVAGRLTGGRLDFAGEPLLQATPLLLDAHSQPTTSYPQLRDALATRLANGTAPLVTPELIGGLSATSVSPSDPAAKTGYTCGWLNMVLFATLDLLRVQSLLATDWDRATSRPGLVLGWAHQDGPAGWVFDCAYRHAWEPPRGYTEAMLGGTCTDPAGLFRDGVEALLAGYAPPEPAPSTQPQPPTSCPKGSIRFGKICIRIPYPPIHPIKDWPPLQFTDTNPILRKPPVETWKDPTTIYGQPPLEVFGEKAFGLTDYVGAPANAVATVLGGFVTAQGAVADIKVVDAGTVGDIEGYAPDGAFAPSDTIVLGTDAQGMIVSTGRVAAVRNVRTVASALPAAVGAAQDAQSAATELRGLAGGLQNRLGIAETTIGAITSHLGSLQGDFTQLTDTLKPSTVIARLAALEGDVGKIGQINTRLDVLDGKVDVISKGRLQLPDLPGGGVITRPDRVVGTPSVDPTLASGIADFTDTAIAALRALPTPQNPNFTRYATAAEHAVAQLRDAAGDAAETTGTAETGVATAGGEPTEGTTLAQATVETLGTLRTLVKAAGVAADAGRDLDAKLRTLKDHLG